MTTNSFTYWSRLLCSCARAPRHGHITNSSSTTRYLGTQHQQRAWVPWGAYRKPTPPLAPQCRFESRGLSTHQTPTYASLPPKSSRRPHLLDRQTSRRHPIFAKSLVSALATINRRYRRVNLCKISQDGKPTSCCFEVLSSGVNFDRHRGKKKFDDQFGPPRNQRQPLWEGSHHDYQGRRLFRPIR